MKKQYTTRLLLILVIAFTISNCATQDVSTISSLSRKRTERLMEQEPTEGMREEDKISIASDDIEMPCQILFVSNRDGDDEIYSINIDGSNIQKFTNNFVVDKQPAWSPDGEEICFSRELAQGSELFLMNRMGDDERQITFSDADYTLPSYSPDGKAIAYISQGTSLYMADSDGSNEEKLTMSYFGGMPPVWSPDSNQIVYSATIDENGYDLFLMNNYSLSKDNDVTQPEDDTPVDVFDEMGTLLSNGSTNYLPDWSPDGTHIIFSSDMDGDPEIYKISSAISEDPEVIQITENQDFIIDFEPKWSPDGNRIAYASNENGNFDIFLIDANGEKKIQLTDDPGFDHVPTWSPDGKMIAFVSNRTGNDEIYLIQPDGTNEQQLTDSEGDSWWPQWLPGCVCP